MPRALHFLDHDRSSHGDIGIVTVSRMLWGQYFKDLNVIVVMLLQLLAMSITAIGSVTPALISRPAMALLVVRVLRADTSIGIRVRLAPFAHTTLRSTSKVHLPWQHPPSTRT
jgi:hypothetical protein